MNDVFKNPSTKFPHFCFQFSIQPFFKKKKKEKKQRKKEKQCVNCLQDMTKMSLNMKIKTTVCSYSPNANIETDHTCKKLCSMLSVLESVSAAMCFYCQEDQQLQISARATCEPRARANTVTVEAERARGVLLKTTRKST